MLPPRRLAPPLRHLLTRKGWAVVGIVAVALVFFGLNFAISWSRYS